MTNPPSPPAPHLGYLLTAYLFGNVSAAGKAQVEAHLAECAQCRAELDELRETLGLASAALVPGGEPRALDEAHRRRIVAAAARHRFERPWYLLSSRARLIAALFAVVVLGGILGMSVLGRKTSDIIGTLSVILPGAMRPAPMMDRLGKDDGRTSPVSNHMRAMNMAKAGVAHSVTRLSTNSGVGGNEADSQFAVPADSGGERESGVVLARPSTSPTRTAQIAAPDSREDSSIAVPPDVVAKAELGDHWETVNLDAHGIYSGRIGGAAAALASPSAPPIERPAVAAGEVLEGVDQAGGTELRYKLDFAGPITSGKTVVNAGTPVTSRARAVEQRDGLAVTLQDADKAEKYTLPALTEQLAAQNEQSAKKSADNEKSAWKDVEDSQISYADTLDYPPNWDKIGRRTENTGGGQAGVSLDDVIGAGGNASPGNGGGWGGGRGEGKPAPGKLPVWNGKAPVDFEISGAVYDPIGEPGAVERCLRGFRYFHAQNPRLMLYDYLNRPAPIPPAERTDGGLDKDLYVEKFGTRPFVDCSRDHLSTFGLDVDTAAYSHARADLRAGKLPKPETVRVEEFVNYFKQPYTVAGDDAFGVFAECAPEPLALPSRDREGAELPLAYARGSESRGSEATGLELLKIGIKSRDARPDERKPALLTFVVDTSGSMATEFTGADAHNTDRLALVRGALKALVETLQPNDAVILVGFSSEAELILPRTPARQKQRILDAIDTLSPHGATNVESGITLAYRLADEAYSPDAVNRMILCSDGVSNIGAKGPDEMLKLVRIFAARGIDLCTIGFGMGQYNDQMMVKLADNGNGTCHFVDTLSEARKIFTEQLPPHLDVLARDAKAQVEFNPEVVARFRQIGYEKRKIADKDFRNDRVVAGEIAHSTLVTVLYEIERRPASHGPLGKIYLRWKDAGYRSLPVVERNYPLSEGLLAPDFEHATPQFRFIACVARFAELLRDSPWVRDSSYADVLEELRRLPADFQARGEWKEVTELVEKAQSLSVAEWVKEMQ